MCFLSDIYIHTALQTPSEIRLSSQSQLTVLRQWWWTRLAFLAQEIMEVAIMRLASNVQAWEQRAVILQWSNLEVSLWFLLLRRAAEKRHLVLLDRLWYVSWPLKGSDMWVDLSSSRSDTNAWYCCWPTSSAWRTADTTFGSMISLVSSLSRSVNCFFQ